MKHLIILSLLLLASCSTKQPTPNLFEGTFRYSPNKEAAYNIDHDVLLRLNIVPDGLSAMVSDKDSNYSLKLSEGSKNKYTGRYISTQMVELIVYKVNSEVYAFYFITKEGQENKGFISKLQRQ